jgi:adenosine deaminase
MAFDGPEALRAFTRTMPKTELHLHLDGSMRPATALELATARRVEGAPRTLEGMREVLIAPEHLADQAELLRAFDLPVAILQDAESLERVAGELVEDKAADDVRYVEIRWAPLLHVARGLPALSGIGAVCRGARRAAERTGIEVRLIATAMRIHDPDANATLAEEAASFLDDGLTGFDLAGPEAAAPDVLAHARAFEVARRCGLQITVHAGEWGGAEQVRRALAIAPARIAHGPGAVDDPGLQAELIARGIALDLAPTSNVQAGIVAEVEDHPLAALHRAGVPVTLSTDDLTVSDVTLGEEYARAVERIGLTIGELWAIDRAGIAHAFCDQATKERLLHAFDGWAAGRAELATG